MTLRYILPFACILSACSAQGQQQEGPVPAVAEIPSLESQVKFETVVEGLDEPWGFVFTGDDDMLITEKTGQLRIVTNGELADKPISGIPTVNNGGQGGLLDVAVDPDYADNKWVYMSFSHPLEGTSGPSMTKIVRGKIVDGAWTSEETLFQAETADYIDTGFHYGSRITFDDAGHLYFSIGDRGKMNQAQDVTRPNGKVHRINRDGSIPEDNPFVGQTGADATIYSYGNRNPQGLIWHPMTDELWSTEHGPKGGDELNRIESGKNYGWPEISYGINYNGTVLTEYTAKPGMEQPVSQWTPSIAVCGLDVYTGDMFPEWKGRLLVGSLAYESLRLVEVKGGKYVNEGELLNAEGRIRDVTTGPDGAIYVALLDQIIKMTPAE